MNRRGFLKYLGAATVASAAGIDLIDTARTFFLPPAGGWRRGNTLLTASQIANEALKVLHQEVLMHDVLYGHAVLYPKIGTPIHVQTPPRYLGVFS